MNITLRLKPEVEHKLKGAAERRGLTVEDYIGRLAEQSVADGGVPAALDPQAWETAWRTWAASHKILPFMADDDREGIYAGRGE